jgi:hypothetical protein
MIYATPRTSVRKWLRSSGQLILDRSFTHLSLCCARTRVLCWIARFARGDVRWSPPSSSDLVKPAVLHVTPSAERVSQLLLQIGGTNIAS